MTERERFLAVFEGRVPDRVPWFADLTYWYGAHQDELPDEHRGPEGYVRFHRDLGVGLYLYPPNGYAVHTDACIETRERRDGDVVVREIHTPDGTLREVTQDLPGTHSTAYVEHAVKTADDLPAVVSLYERRSYEADYDAYAATDRLWGDGALPVPLTPFSPLQHLVTRLAGVANLVYMFADAPKQLDWAVAAMQRALDPAFDIMADMPCRVVEMPENLSSEVTGRRLFERYCLDYYRRRNAQLHAGGKWVGAHIDGTLRGLLEMYTPAGFDFAESVTPAPVGDVAVEAIRGLAGDDLILIGGVPGAIFSPLFGEAQFEQHILRTLRAYPPGSKFILAAADQVPPDASLARVRRVRELVDGFGAGR